MPYGIRQLINRYFQRRPAPPAVSEPIPPQTYMWTTREGEVMQVCEMKDSHLLNALRLKRGMQIVLSMRYAVQGYACVGAMQGEEAQESAWAELDAFEASYNLIPDADVPGLMPLILEARRRGLTER